MRRRGPIILELTLRSGRAVLAVLPALAIGSVATPERVEALIDCNDPALLALKLPDPGPPVTNGWTSTGATLEDIPPKAPGSIPEVASGDQNGGTAQLFTQQVGGNTCFYLRRNKLPAGTLNGVLCFDPTDCSVCAWDLVIPSVPAPPPDPKDTLFSNMLNTTSYGTPGGIQDCSECHVSGITMPMQAMYKQTDQLDLMNKCVEVGGPKWVGAPPGWAVQDPTRIVAPDAVPESCGVCHDSGFLKPQANQAAWCDFAGQAFKTGGSMAKDYSNEECRTFMSALECDPELCGIATAPIVPAMSNWSLAGLGALLCAATWLVARRNAPR